MRKLLFLLTLILLVISISMCENPETEKNDDVKLKDWYASEEELFADLGIDINTISYITVNSPEELKKFKSSLDLSSKECMGFKISFENTENMGDLDDISRYPMKFSVGDDGDAECVINYKQ